MYNDFECSCGCCSQSGCGEGDNCQCLGNNNNSGCNCTTEFKEVTNDLEQIIALDTQINNNSSETITLLEEIKDAISSDECPCAEVLEQIRVNTFNGTAVLGQINIHVLKIMQSLCEGGCICDGIQDINDTLINIEEKLEDCCKHKDDYCAIFDNPVVDGLKLIYNWENFDENIPLGKLCFTFADAGHPLQVYVKDGHGKQLKVSFLGGIESLIGLPSYLPGIELYGIYSEDSIKIFADFKIEI